jgi:Ser/Thr protein kinase RdoA (MazF antagonist)
MGIIKKILHHSNPLRLSRFASFFLDMEENIHIHYRDLRIELSRGEFEDFVRTFRAQSDSLLKIISETDYQDGKLPNANKKDVRIWLESRLKHSIKYHPTRLSIEECTDGYHLHYRNYKILLDELEFIRLRQAFASLGLPEESVGTYHEVVKLLNSNHIDYIIDQGNNPDAILAIAVAHYHQGKVDTIFKAYGFQKSQEEKQLVYTGDHLTVRVKIYGESTSIAFSPGKAHGDTLLLSEYLTSHAINNDVNLVNALKCQVLDLYWQISNSGQSIPVELDPNLWLISRNTQCIIFPLSHALPSDNPAVQSEQLLKHWSVFQSKFAISSAKPNKIIFDEKLQSDFYHSAISAIMEKVASSSAVSKIFLMGSASRMEMGMYCSPYAYGKLAKIGSDIDILVEIEAGMENQVPLEWKLISRHAQDSGCSVYHIHDIQTPVPISHFTSAYPNIALSHHIIDAHVFFPAKGDSRAKATFLGKHKAKVIYDKSVDGVFQPESTRQLVTELSSVIDFKPLQVSVMPVHTQNKLYCFSDGRNDFILKLHIVAGNLKWDQISDHTLYEHDLLSEIHGRGLSVPAVASTRGAIVEKFPAIVFERVKGSVLEAPPYPLAEVTKALAEFHQTQIDNPLSISTNFTFENVWRIWIKSFNRKEDAKRLPDELVASQSKLQIFADKLCGNKPETGLFGTSPRLHLQGDVTPRNFIVGDRVFLFDFNNACFGPRIVDVVDGAFEFTVSDNSGEFMNFDSFIELYQTHSKLNQSELDFLSDWILTVGLIKFAKELKMVRENNNTESRIRRACRIAEIIFSKVKLGK